MKQNNIIALFIALMLSSDLYAFKLVTEAHIAIDIPDEPAQQAVPAPEILKTAFEQSFDKIDESDELAEQEYRSVLTDLAVVEQAKADLARGPANPQLGIQLALNIRALKLHIAYIFQGNNRDFGPENKATIADEFVEFNWACWEKIREILPASSLPVAIKTALLACAVTIEESTTVYKATQNRELLKTMAILNMEIAVFMRDLQ